MDSTPIIRTPAPEQISVSGKPKPRLLDLFSGAGGAAKGYQRAGFYVVGVDIKPQPNYCGDEFYEGDAMEYPLEGFAAIHASPPCQGYSRLRHLPWLNGREYPMLIPGTRERLHGSGVPWVIENVLDAPLDPSIVLCGTTLGLPLSRHRKFELSHWMLAPQCTGHPTIEPGHKSMGKRYPSGVTGVLKEINRDGFSGHGQKGDRERARRAMGIDWMTHAEIVQAIPPAYTEWIGTHLMNAIKAAA